MARDHSATRTRVDDICLRKKLTYLQSSLVQTARLLPIPAPSEKEVTARLIPTWRGIGTALFYPAGYI
jgi:hypothetical protein